MWRPIRKGELSYMQRMEERVWKRRLLDWLAMTAVMLLLVLGLTYSSYTKEENRLVDTYIGNNIVYGLTDLLKNLSNPDYKPQLESSMEEMGAGLHRLKITYCWIYGLECLLAAGIYIGCAYSNLQKINEILAGPLQAQYAVCTGKREYHSRSSVRVYINFKTDSDETIRDIQVPWMVGSKLECDMHVLAVRYTQTGEEGEEEVSYKLYPVRKKGMKEGQHVERDQ